MSRHPNSLRRLIELLTEDAFNTTHAEVEGLGLFVYQDKSSLRLTLFRPDVLVSVNNTLNPVVGTIRLIDELSCKAWMMVNAAAEKGYGPLLFDLAMSHVHPRFVVADNVSVSPSALRVMSYMFLQRRNDFDIQKIKGATCLPRNKEEAVQYRYRIKSPLDPSRLLAAAQKAYDTLGLSQPELETKLRNWSSQFYQHKMGY